MFRGPLLVVSLAGLVAAVALPGLPAAFAQSSGMFGSRGAVTATQGNSAYSSSSALGQSGAGATGMGGMGMAGQTGMAGAGGMGRAPGGMGGAGAATGPQMSGISNQGAMSATVGQDGFIGRAAQQGFVGNRLAGQQTGMQNQNFGAGQRGGNRPGGNPNNSFQQGNQFGSAGRNQTQRIVRPQQRIAFSHPQPTPASIETSLQTQLGRLADRTQSLNGVALDVAPTGEVILRGQVADEESRRLAEMYVRLEPGVRAVRNELTVR